MYVCMCVCMYVCVCVLAYRRVGESGTLIGEKFSLSEFEDHLFLESPALTTESELLVRAERL